MNHYTIDNHRAAIAAARLAAATAVTLAFLLAGPAFAGRFSEWDATSHSFDDQQTASNVTTSDESRTKQVAEAETVMSDATSVDELRLELQMFGGRTQWWQAPGNPQFGGR